jgi:hypothetical protein
VEEVARVLRVLKADKELAEVAAGDSGAAAAAAAAAGGAVPASSSRSAARPVPDHFSVLDLPPPQVNAAGEGVWLVDDETLKRAFKRVCLPSLSGSNCA